MPPYANTFPVVATQPYKTDLEKNALYVAGFMARRCYSKFISCATFSQFSHAGAVFYYQGEWWVTHSTPNPAKLVAINETQWRSGVLMVRLADEIHSGWYEYVKLYKVKNLDLTESRKSRLFNRYQRNKHKRYEQNWMEIGFSALDCTCCGRELCGNTASREEFFCSEWAAHFINEFMSLDKVDSEYTPEDLANLANVEHAKTIKGPPQSTAECCSRFWNFDA